MPEKVSVNERATVAAGFANEVDEGEPVAGGDDESHRVGNRFRPGPQTPEDG